MILQTRFILFMGVVREAMTITTICNWYKRFRTGNFYSKDEGRSCHPAATNMDATNISKKTVYNHLIKIGYVNRWVFRFHTNGDRLYEPRIYMRFFFQRHERNPFLKRLVTGDEIWILYQNVHR